MINLVIDIGNTSAKVALFDNRLLKELRVLKGIQAEAISELFSLYRVDNAIMSTVAGVPGDIEAYLQANCRYLRFNVGLYPGMINRYKTPQTLGLDRFAGVIGARSLFPSANCLVIDAGSCITYDFVDSAGSYHGGSISPGIAMRFKAMNTFTERLPLLEPVMEFDEVTGVDTRTAMQSGVMSGVLFEVEGFISHYSAQWDELKILLCGGDVNFFDTRLKNSIFARNIIAEPNLVLIGLNEVVHQNNE